jgi:hypothetical protein
MIVKRLYYTCNMHLTYPAVLEVDARCCGALLMCGIRSVWDCDLASLIAGRSELELLSKNPPQRSLLARKMHPRISDLRQIRQKINKPVLACSY